MPTKGDDNYLGYKVAMLKEFVKIPNNGGIYWPDHFQAWGIDPKDITSGDLGKIFKVNMTQKDFYVDLCEAITTCLASSREDYAGEYAGLPRRHAGGYLRRGRPRTPPAWPRPSPKRYRTTGRNSSTR